MKKRHLTYLKNINTLEGVYENIDNIKGKLKEKLINDKENAFLSKDLGSIVVDMDVNINLDEECKFDFNNEKFISILSELDLKSIMKKLGVENIGKSKDNNDNFTDLKEEYLKIGEDINVDSLCETLNTRSSVSIYFVLNDENNKIKEAMIFDGEKFYLADLSVLSISDIVKIMKANKNIITHDFKNVYKCFKHEGYDDIECLFDTYIGGYVLNPSDERYSLEVMGKKIS